MPELPEIETIRRDLEPALRGDHLVSIDVADPRLMSCRECERWKSQALHQTWEAIERRGKYLVVRLANASRLVFHMRMTGQMVVNIKEEPPRFRMRLTFASGKTLTLIDQRRFAEAWLLSPEQAWPSASPLGPDALTELNKERFLKIIKRTTRIQPLLMDQRLLAGVGNIYAQEALFKASIRPSRSGRRVSEAEGIRLFEALQETLQVAIDHRGSTSRNYRDAYGRAGTAQTLHAVYRQGGKPCPRCQKPLRSTRVGGRGTVYCSQCQK